MTSFTWPTCLWWLLRPHRWPWYFLNSSSWNLVFARKQGLAGFGKRTHVQKKECWMCVKAGWLNKWVTFIDNQKICVTSRQVALVSSRLRVLAEQLCWVVFKTSSCNNRNYRIVTRDALMLRNSCLWDRQASIGIWLGALWSSGNGERQIWSSLIQTWVMFTWLYLHGSLKEPL